MARRAGVALVLAAALAPPAASQVRPAREMRSFEPAFGVGLGVSRFGTRATAPGGTVYSYSSSVAIDAGGEAPITRRSGVLFNVTAAPLARARRKDPIAVLVTDRVVVIAADAAVGWRFKPWAPAFLAAGGGWTYASRRAVEDDEGSGSAPHALLTIGIDRSIRSTTALRLRVTGRFVRAIISPQVNVTGTAPFDLSVIFSIRRRATAFD